MDPNWSNIFVYYLFLPTLIPNPRQFEFFLDILALILLLHTSNWQATVIAVGTYISLKFSYSGTHADPIGFLSPIKIYHDTQVGTYLYVVLKDQRLRRTVMLLFCAISNSDVADVVSILNCLSRDPPSEYHTHMHISIGLFCENFYNERHVPTCLFLKGNRNWRFCHW